MRRDLRSQTKPSLDIVAVTAAGFGFPMEINWSLVGSAQQYHGSLRNGTARGSTAQRKRRHCNSRNSVRGFPDPLERCGASQLLAIGARSNFLYFFRKRIHTRIRMLPRINQRLANRKDRSARRMSSSSSMREPSGISRRIPNCIGATFSVSSSSQITRNKSR